MAEIVLFHHVQGLTEGVEALADHLRAGGHTVHTPDLFAGRTFATLDDGMAHAREVGFGTILEQGVAVGEQLSREADDGLVHAGLSMGVMPAQQLAQTSRGVRGAVFLHACLPVAEFGDGWPDGVPVQVHGMDGDPFFAEDGGDLDAARHLVQEADEGELFLYQGSSHLFTDASLASYDADAAGQVVERVLGFLDGLG